MKRNIFLQFLHWLTFLFENEPHICVNCSWSYDIDDKDFICKAPQLITINKINGEKTYYKCTDIRVKDYGHIPSYCKGFDPKI